MTGESEEIHDVPYYEQTIREIKNGDEYVCMICTVEMDAACRMYACDKCYRVFDYDCVREWALKSTGKTLDKSWKCPNCYKVNHKVPPAGRSTCWCGKVVEPEVNESDPNSCGQTCNAKKCIHGCSKICHLGPHPECLIPVTVSCKCGKHTKQVPCSSSRKVGKHFNCGNVCGLLLPCGKHTCQKKCHTGFCGPCETEITSELPCYCGLEAKKGIKCSSIKVVDYSKSSTGDKWIGVFACDKVRTLHYACDEHSYTETCQAPVSIDKSKPCPFSPKALHTCPCGRTALAELETPRKKCTDPIPTCENTCGKPLSCGKHKCPFTCHTGDCMDPCLIIEKKPCSCRSNNFLVPCQFHESPRCKIKCESNMSCRRHKCFKICCEGKPAAKVREKSLFLKKDRNDETLVEPQHICLKQCNKKLSCGIHDCTWKCHPGKCPPCLESDSNDLVCPCGKTCVPAPVRCGTKLPPCPHPCVKISQGPAPCGHRRGPHKCHPLEEECPPCTVQVTKKCRCHKQQNVLTLCMVSQDQVSCGTECGLPLANCHHKCRNKCHVSGQCDTKCNQICGLRRTSCAHKCKEKCHGKLPCPEKECKEKVAIYCDCNRRTKMVECGATLNNPSRAVTEKLPCDEECAKLKRHMELMEAFGMNDKLLTSKEKMESVVNVAKTFDDLGMPYSEICLNVYNYQTSWCSQIIEVFDKFLDDSTKISLHLKPMRAPQRQFVHELAAAYGLYSESQDPEPNRSVYLKKIRSQSKIPTISLKDASNVYQKFKVLQKERKQAHYESTVTKTLVNIEVQQTANDQTTYDGPNAILISGVGDKSRLDTLKPIAHEYLKYTLVKSPQYKYQSESKSVVIYPEDFENISMNAVKDMEKVIPFIKDSLENHLMATEVSMCKLLKDLTLAQT